MIILVWNEYVMNMVRMPGWMLGFLDSYLPFLLGIAEVGAVYGTQQHSFPMWSGWMTAAMGFGTLGFVNTYARTDWIRQPRPALKRLLQFRAINIAGPALMGIVMAVLTYVYRSGEITERQHIVVGVGMQLFWLAFLGRILFIWHRRGQIGSKESISSLELT